MSGDSFYDDSPGPAQRRPVPAPIRARARHAVSDSGPPTVPITPPRRPSGLTAEVERSVVELVLRTGEAFTATGTPVADATAALYRLAAGFGVTSCQISLTFTTIMVSIERDDDPITQVRVAGARASDYSRLAALFELTEDAGNGKIDIAEAQRRLDEIVNAPHPYRRWVVTAALGVMAAGVAAMLGGGWLIALIASGTAMAIDRVLRYARHKDLPHLFQQASGALIATTVALVLLWAEDAFDLPSAMSKNPSLVVASSIVVLLAGLSLVGAAEDAISGFPLTAAARGLEVLLATVGIVVGIGFMLNVGRGLGIPLTINAEALASASAVVLILSGAVVAGGWGVASYARPLTVILAMPAGATATVSFTILRDLSVGPATAAFIAATIVGLVASTAADHLGAEPIVVSICGVVPLLPGLAIYSALFTIVQDDSVVQGGAQLVGALGIGLALAAGVTLGEIIARPLRPESDLWQLRVRRRARGTRF